MSDRGQPRQARGFLVPISVVLKAKRMGLTVEELQDMVRRSARCTHELGNRRYHDYIFNVEGQRVISIAELDYEEVDIDEPLEVTYKCDTCKDQGTIPVFDECPRCEGEGCKRCDEGLVPSKIPCPDCRKHKRRRAYPSY